MPTNLLGYKEKSPTPLVREIELCQRTGQLFYVLLGEGHPLGITLALYGLGVKDAMAWGMEHPSTSSGQVGHGVKSTS